MAEKSLPEYDASELTTSENKDDFLGCGTFAAARKCWYKRHRGQAVAVKCFKIQGSKDEQIRAMEKVMREIKILSRLKHDNIVGIYGITRWENYVGIVMEFVNGKSLEDLIKSRKVTYIPWELRLRFNKEITDALAYLHYADPRKKFIHGDLKSQNVLLTLEMQIKIADFGSTNIVLATGASKMSVDVTNTSQHTPYYSAPEVLNEPLMERKVSVDVYSFSMIGYEIFTRRSVFVAEGVNPQVILASIKSKKGLTPYQQHLDVVEKSLENQPENIRIFHLLKEIMMRCWCRDPDKRPDIRQVRDELNKIYNNLDRKDVEEAVRSVQAQLQLQDEHESSAAKVELKEFHFPFEEAHSSLSTPDIQGFIGSEATEKEEFDEAMPRLAEPTYGPQTNDIRDNLAQSTAQTEAALPTAITTEQSTLVDNGGIFDRTQYNFTFTNCKFQGPTCIGSSSSHQQTDISRNQEKPEQ